MAKMCPILSAADGIGRGMAYASDSNVSSVIDAVGDSTNNGTCMEAGCEWWVGDTPETSSCVFVKSVQKQSSMIKVLDYIHNVMRDISAVIRARL